MGRDTTIIVDSRVSDRRWRVSQAVAQWGPPFKLGTRADAEHAGLHRVIVRSRWQGYFHRWTGSDLYPSHRVSVIVLNRYWARRVPDDSHPRDPALRRHETVLSELGRVLGVQPDPQGVTSYDNFGEHLLITPLERRRQAEALADPWWIR